MVYKNYYKVYINPSQPFTWEKKKVNKVPCVFSEYLYVISKHMIKSTIPKESKPKASLYGLRRRNSGMTPVIPHKGAAACRRRLQFGGGCGMMGEVNIFVRRERNVE